MQLKKIFFSYSRADGSDFALRLALDLKKEGFQVWIDQQDIRAGSEWDLEIEKALETCDCLLFIETEKSVSSNNVLDEVYYSLEQKKKVIPVIRCDSKTPFRLQRLQHIDFTKSYEAGLVHLIGELRGSAATDFFGQAEYKRQPKGIQRFFAKTAARIGIIAFLAMAVAVAVIYAVKNKETAMSSPGKVMNTSDTTAGESLTGRGPDMPSTGETPGTTQKKIIKSGTGSNTGNSAVKRGASLNETFSGHWRLMDVEPAGTSYRGYL
ncbi:MAG TPA: toll/interleukin-1 receptor domain-containing protein, partial [Agriterribacter sp.]|nr:toll/interleukin-1 receptor domain-containing protein [Agriterribacter sp.]